MIRITAALGVKLRAMSGIHVALASWFLARKNGIQSLYNPYLGVSQNKGYLIGGPHNKDYIILGSILGSSYFGKPPYNVFLYSLLRPIKLGSGLRSPCW